MATTSWSVIGLAVGYPLGLSFIILMLHSAVTDAHSGKYVPDGKFSTFLLFGTFFPYVTAGPVERLHRMERPLGAPVRPTRKTCGGAVAHRSRTGQEGRHGQSPQAICRLRIHRRPPKFDADDAVAITLNAAYVYADFSGYTDIARGAARCLGIDIKINFDQPCGRAR